MEERRASVSAPVRPLASAGGDRLQQLLHRWFVEYNPAYFASALCLLAGIFLISDGMGGAEERSGEIWLFGIVQLYELLLIGGAAFLYRVLHQRRPAVVLAIVEMVYLLDPTMQTEVAAYAVPGRSISSVSTRCARRRCSSCSWRSEPRARWRRFSDSVFTWPKSAGYCPPEARSGARC